MSFYDAIRVGASGAAEDFEIERSIRNDQGTADVNNGSNFEKTYSSAGNRKTFTISVWVKKCNTPGNIGDGDDGYSIFTTGGGGSGAQSGNFGWTQPDDKLYFLSQPQPSPTAYLITNRLFRDYGAWYHLVVAVDTTQATASNRVKIYVNGVQETSFSTATYPSQNDDLQFNHAVRHRIGSNSLGSDLNSTYANLNGYLADFNFIDGLQLTPASFGETKATTGQWIPIDTAGLTFGSNGFRLEFKDNSATTATTLGKDTSGNSNNFTPNGYSVSAGVGNDSVTDTPTNNWCTLTPIDIYGDNVAEKVRNGNLEAKNTSGSYRVTASTFYVTTGKWYWEVKILGIGGASLVGVACSDYDAGSGARRAYNGNGQKYIGSGSSYGATFTTNDIIGTALDLDNGTITFYKNGVSQGVAFTDLLTAMVREGWTPIFNGYNNSEGAFNFGQKAFDYTPPTGYKTLNSANLPDPTILLPNKEFDTKLWTGNGGTQTITGLNFSPDWVWIKIRSQAYNHVLWDAVRGATLRIMSNKTNAEQTNTNGLTAFNSDGYTLGDMNNVNKSGDTFVGWNWNAGDTDSATYRVVVVSDSGNKYRFRNSANTATFAQSAVTLNLAEGGTYIFNMDDATNATHPFSIGTAANGTVYTSGITYFLDGVSKTYSQYTSGFASATTRRLHITVPASAPQLYYWCSAHSGMGGAINTNSTLGSSNFDGTIQSTAKVNATAGFSIVTYTGNGTGGATIGHGLGVRPNWIIAKDRSASRSWAVGSDDSPWTLNLRLDEDSSPSNTSQSKNQWYETTPTSTVFYVGDGDVGDYSGDTNVNTENYVAYCFSEVTGYSRFGKYTGNNANNGTFVFTGFSVAWLLVKRTDSTRDWLIYDNTRSTFNVIDDFLEPNQATAEQQASANSVDFVSNGFKFRNNSGDMNGSGTYIYFAFAEAPFRNARAR